MSNKEKQIEGDDQADLQKYTELEYKALKKENAQLKQAVEDDCADRKLEITGELNASKLKDKCLALLNSHASSSSTPSRPIESLPPAARVHDPCLIALFKQLPPADQLTARKVCSRWADLVTYAARSTRSLAIFLGDRTIAQFAKSVNYYSLGSIKVVSLLKKEDGSPMFPQSRFSQWNSLLYRRGLEDEAIVEAIGATFVNLDTLQVSLIGTPSSQLDFISLLLELLAHHQKLTTLKLWEEIHRQPDRRPPIRLFAAINILHLKHLHLHLSSLRFHDLPVISKLEQLHVHWTGRSPQQFAALLRQHATANTSLRSVKYFSIDIDSDIQHFIPLGDHLLARFTHLGSYRSQFTNSQLISTHFRHLTSLSIDPTDITFRRLFDHLSQLTKLLYLQLSINFKSILPDDQSDLILPQLKSIKALELLLIIRSHLELEQLKIGWTMPNVEAIELNVYGLSKCTDCTIDRYLDCDMKTNLATFKHCYRQMLTPLKAKCTQLRAILHNHEAILGSAEELLK